MKKHIIILLSLMIIALAGCSFRETSTSAPTPTQAVSAAPTNTEAPTNKPTESPTETPTATPTEAPTNTPTITPTETPTNTPTLTPTPTKSLEIIARELDDKISSDDSLSELDYYDGAPYKYERHGKTVFIRSLTDKGYAFLKEEMEKLGLVIEYKGNKLITKDGKTFMNAMYHSYKFNEYYTIEKTLEEGIALTKDEETLFNYLSQYFPEEMRADIYCTLNKYNTADVIITDHKHDFNQGTFCQTDTEIDTLRGNKYYNLSCQGKLVEITDNFNLHDSSTWKIIMENFPSSLTYDIASIPGHWVYKDGEIGEYIKTIPAGEYIVIREDEFKAREINRCEDKNGNIFEIKITTPIKKTVCEYITIYP